MSPIKEKNLRNLDRLEDALKKQLVWVGRDGLQQSVDAIDRLRNLKQFVIALAITTVSILFPLLIIVQDKIVYEDIFVIALILFSYVILYGLIRLVIPTLREVITLPRVSEHHRERILKMIKEIQKIKKMDDNDTAGRKLKEFKSRHSKMPEVENLGLIKRYWARYDPVVFFAVFITGYIFLIVGFITNFWP